LEPGVEPYLTYGELEDEGSLTIVPWWSLEAEKKSTIK